MSILSDRYASPEMKKIWSRELRYISERKLWLSVLRIQNELGMHVPEGAIKAYESCLSEIDLEAIDARELATGHDVKARIEEFNSLAGYELIHIGMTSRDLTENVEILQIRSSLSLIINKSKTLLWALGERASMHASDPIVARTHNVPAQLTTIGKKIATWAEELKFAIDNLEHFMTRLPFKGIHGAVGTNLDLINLLPGNHQEFEEKLNRELGFGTHLYAPAQIYPRSIDFELVSSLFQVAASPSNLATNIRLMSGLGLVSEGLQKGKTGSSAMPHKVNPRLSERLNSLTAILRGHVTMVASISGDQWNEGDVSCSALRRIVLPDSFFTIDGILDTANFLVNQIVFDQVRINDEIEEVLPEITSSILLMRAVKRGVGREVAHDLLKKHAGVAKADPSKKFFDLVLADSSLPIDSSDIKEITKNILFLVGNAPHQAKSFADFIRRELKDSTNIIGYPPQSIR